MEFNSDKFKLMRIGKYTNIKESTEYFSEDYNELIERKVKVKYLGVSIDEYLNF